MKKSLPFLFIIVLASFAHARDIESAAGAGGDICDTRPDLCGSVAPSSKKKKKRSVRRHPASAKPAEKVDDDLELEFGRKPRPAFYESTPVPGAVTYESYLQANSMHPAIARRPASMQMNQKAFVQPTVRSTITGSTLDQPAQNKPSAGPNNSFDPPANTGHGVGDATPSTNGINPGDAPSAAPVDGPNGSPLH